MQINWNLDDDSFRKLHSFSYPKAFTYADTRPGHTDKEKREYIRSKAENNFPKNIKSVKWWAFRIFVQKSGKKPFDIENVPKLIIDAFCKNQITRDGSKFPALWLYKDDTIDIVKVLEIYGERTLKIDSTQIEIFGKR